MVSKKTVIAICGTGVHKGAIELQEYPTNIGFLAALKLFIEKHPLSIQIAICYREAEL